MGTKPLPKVGSREYLKRKKKFQKLKAQKAKKESKGGFFFFFWW
nr:hypothetical protein [Psychrobacter sp.]